MTPEQRETLSAMADEESMLASAARDGGPTQLRRLARCAAIRAALAAPPPAAPLTAFQREAREKLRAVLANYNLLDAIHGLGRDVDEAVRLALGALANPTPTDAPPPSPPADLVALGDRLRTQDNQMTAHPIFVVEHRGDARRPWEFVTACLTDEGARNYMSANGHNLRKFRRIFVHSGYRNDEWIGLRNYLLSLPAAPRVPDTPQGRICTKCGTTMVQRFEYRRVNNLTNVAIPNGFFDCMKCGATAPPQEPPR